MPFEKGNTLSQCKRKPGGGRKPKLSTQVKRALANIPVVDIFDWLQSLAEKGDREACIYLLDRVMGKPTQKSEIELEGGVNISALEIVDVIQKARKEFIEQTEVIKIPTPESTQLEVKDG